MKHVFFREIIKFLNANKLSQISTMLNFRTIFMLFFLSFFGFSNSCVLSCQAFDLECG